MLFKPLLKRDALRLLNVQTATVKAARGGETQPGYERLYNKLAPPSKALQRYPWLHPFSRIMLPAIEQIVVKIFEQRMREQMAGAPLAIRPYQRDHADRRPRTLQKLVPEYLDTVPRDRFARSNQPIGCKPAGITPDVKVNIRSNAIQPATGPSATHPAKASPPTLSIL